MSASEREVLEALDRLAGIADTDPVGDRMPDIRRRVRVARRRKAAGVVAATALAVVGGLGVWQALPVADSEPDVVDNGAAGQRIEITAEPVGDQLQISATISGTSSVYTDEETGEPSDYAGPQSIEITVEGGQVAYSNRQGLDCRPTEERSSYTVTEPADGPIGVPLAGAALTMVQVSAPYCDDGELVRSTQTLPVRIPGVPLPVTSRERVDLDADGARETVLMRTDEYSSVSELTVEWGSGETTTQYLTEPPQATLLDPVDLDDDGDLELLVAGGGGEYYEVVVFQVDPSAITAVRAESASGASRRLLSGADPSVWRVNADARGIVSYKLVDPEATSFPAEVRVRQWTLQGDTLVEGAEETTACVTFQPRFVLGPCS